MVFPTGVSTPPWRWVPDEFRDEPGGDYDNATNPWCQCVSQLFGGRQKWADWSAIPREGVDGEQAHRAVVETMGNWGIKHQRKIATTAYMLSEWFADFWFKGDTHSRILKLKIPAQHAE